MTSLEWLSAKIFLELKLNSPGAADWQWCGIVFCRL